MWHRHSCPYYPSTSRQRRRHPRRGPPNPADRAPRGRGPATARHTACHRLPASPSTPPAAARLDRAFAVGAGLLVLEQPFGVGVEEVHAGPSAEVAEPVGRVLLVEAGEGDARGLLEEGQPLVVEPHLERWLGVVRD